MVDTSSEVPRVKIDLGDYEFISFVNVGGEFLARRGNEVHLMNLDKSTQQYLLDSQSSPFESVKMYDM